MEVNKKILFFVLSILAVIVTMAGYYWKRQQVSPTSLSELIELYGFKTAEQKEALELLMKKAGILKPTESFNILFPKRTTSDLLFQDLLKFIELNQQYFTIRIGNQERWEIKPTAWMEKNQQEILKALDKLGLISAVAPTFSNPDVICILGCTNNCMVNRLGYAGELYNKKVFQAKYLVLLTGERRVTIGVDGTEPELTAIAKKYGVKLSDLTETHMIQESYRRSPLFQKLQTEVIDTPAGNLPRPTTATTTQAFCQWLKKHPEIKSVIFVSDQPHIKYQRAVISEVLRHQSVAIKFEVIGTEISSSDSIQELVSALGSQIWAETPSVLAKANLTITNPEIRKAFLELYIKQPLIYKNVESLLK